MPFIAKCDFCGKAHRCRDTSHERSLTCKQCEVSFVAMDPSREPAFDLETPQLPPRRKRRTRPKRPEFLDAEESTTDKARAYWTAKRLMFVFGGCAAVCGIVVYCKFAFVPVALRQALGVCAMACAYFAHHMFCSYRIRSEVDAFGGKVDSIRWRPFQGAFFSRGWHVQRIYTFYTVHYQERDGTKKESMCGVSWIFGTRWDWD